MLNKIKLKFQNLISKIRADGYNLVHHFELRDYQVAFIYFVLVFLITSKFWFDDGIISYFHDWSFSLLPENLKLYNREVLYSFYDKGLGTGPTYSTSYLYLLLISFFGFLGINGAFLSKFVLSLIIFAAGFLSFRFLKKILQISPFPAFVASLFYALNPFVFHRATAGHIYFLIAYSVQFLFLEFALKAFGAKEIKKVISYSFIAAFFAFIAGWQIQFYAWIAPIYLIFLISYKGTFLNKALSTLIISILNILYATPWFLVLLLKRNLLDGFQGSLSLNSLVYQSKFTSIFNVLQVRDGIAPYYSFAFESLNSGWQYFYYFSFFAIILFVLLGVFLGISKKVILAKDLKTIPFISFFVILLGVVLFLAKGSNGFGGGFFLNLYKNFQAIALFREIYHYQVLIPFIYIIFAGISFEFFYQKLLSFDFKKRILESNKLNQFFKRILGKIPNNIVASLLIIIPLGYFPIYFNPGLSKQLETYNTSYQAPLQDELRNHRVWFLPNYQPLTLDETAKYGGFDIFQAYGNFSAVSQGDAKDVTLKTITYRLNYCIIFDINCEYEIPKILNLIGVDRIVVQKNLHSLTYLFTPLGVDGNLAQLFKNFDYISKLKSLNFETLDETNDFIVFEVKNPRPLISVNQTTLYTIGSTKQIVGDVFNQKSDIINIRRSSINNLPDGDLLVFNNKKDLIPLELNKKVIVIEPGFYSDSEDWQTYYNFWWRKNFTSSGYNGIFSKTPNSQLSITFGAKESGNYNLLVSLGQQDPEIKSKFRITIGGYTKDIVNTSENRNQAVLNLGSVPLNAGNNNLKIQNLEGETMIDAIFFEPSNSPEIKNDKTNFYALNYPESVNYSKSNNFKIDTELKNYTISSYSIIPGGTKFETEDPVDDFTKITAKFHPNETDTGEFVSLRYDLNDVPLTDFEKLDAYEFNYKIPTPQDVLIDCSINFKINGEEKSIFYKRFDSLTPEGLVNVDLNDLDKAISNSFYGGKSFNKDEFYVTSINLYLNKKIKRAISNADNIFYISNPYFKTSKTKFLSQDDYIYLSNIFNKNFYFNSIFEYFKVVKDSSKLSIKVNPDKQNQPYGPYRFEDRKSQFDFSNNEFTLTTTEAENKAEFGIYKIPLRYNDIKNYDSLIVPIELADENSFIDGVFTATTADNKSIRSQPNRNTIQSDGKQYILFDLKQALAPFKDQKTLYLDLVMNKKLGNIGTNKLKFKISDLTFLKDYNSYFLVNNKLDVKKTFMTVNIPKEGDYMAQVVFDWGAKLELPVQLKYGLNDIEIPPQSQTSKISYVLFSPKSDQSILNEYQALNFKKKNSTEYTFELNPDQLTTKNLFLNFSVTYDPDWQLFKDGKLVGDSFRGNLIFNAFNIENPEVGTYTLKYRLQNYRVATLGLVFTLFLAQLLWFGYQFAHRKYGFSLPLLLGKSKDKLKLGKSEEAGE